MNKVMLQGRLTADPAVYQSDNFTSINFTLAVNRTYKNKDGEYETDFINCNLTRNPDLFRDACKKGSFITIVGEWRTGMYTNREGRNIYTNTCQVSEYYLLPKSSNTTEQSNDDEQLASRTSTPITHAPMKDDTIDLIGTPIKIEEQITIPQAFSSDVDMSDEFPF